MKPIKESRSVDFVLALQGKIIDYRFYISFFESEYENGLEFQNICGNMLCDTLRNARSDFI